jgi:hypothetical protein
MTGEPTEALTGENFLNCQLDFSDVISTIPWLNNRHTIDNVSNYPMLMSSKQRIDGITFESIVETAKKYIPILRQQADVVVVSYHGGFERNLMTGEPTEALTGENEGYQLLQEVSGLAALRLVYIF